MTPVSTTLPALGTAALRLSSLGHLVFPVHTSVGTRCSCRNPKCPNPGKHPRTAHGLKDASSDPEQIQKWWTATPDANIGLRTGAGLLVVDIDPARGGEDSMTALLTVNGSLPPTPEAVTGSGGRHIYFQTDGEVRNSVSAVGAGIDIRGDGGFVVAPPSIHATGRSYEWASGRGIGDLPLAPVPQWLLTLCVRRPTATAPSTIPSSVIEGGRNEFLFKQAASLRGKAFPEETILTAMLSLNATKCHPPLDEVEVRQIVSKVVRNYQEGYFSGQVRSDGTPDRAGRIVAGEEPSSPQSDSDWEQELVYDHKNRVDAGVPGNAMLLIANLDEWRGCLQFDAFANRITWVKKTPTVAGMPSPTGDLNDEHVIFVQQWLAKYRGVKFAKTAVQDALVAAGKSNRIHPLQDYLNGLPDWDGVPRLSTWLTTYLGAASNTYTQTVGQLWMIAAIARAMAPGCQADYALVLEGPQGAGKSSAVRILAGQWYLGSLPDLNNDVRAMDAINGHWIVEMGELDAMRGTAITRVKNFLTQVSDCYRASYARFKETHQRGCIFIGTTNEHRYLHDPSGSRRFWPVLMRLLRREQLTRDRDLLWAEALRLFRDGAQWHPPRELEDALRAEQEDRFDTDPWEDVVATWLADPSKVGDELTTSHLLSSCVQVRVENQDRIQSNRIAGIMRRLGYRYVTKRLENEDGGARSFRKEWRLEGVSDDKTQDFTRTIL